MRRSDELAVRLSALRSERVPSLVLTATLVAPLLEEERGDRAEKQADDGQHSGEDVHVREDASSDGVYDRSPCGQLLRISQGLTSGGLAVERHRVDDRSLAKSATGRKLLWVLGFWLGVCVGGGF